MDITHEFKTTSRPTSSSTYGPAISAVLATADSGMAVEFANKEAALKARMATGSVIRYRQLPLIVRMRRNSVWVEPKGSK